MVPELPSPHDPAEGPAPAAAPSRAVSRIAGEALPPELVHLAEGAFGEALTKAVEYA